MTKVSFTTFQFTDPFRRFKMLIWICVFKSYQAFESFIFAGIRFIFVADRWPNRIPFKSNLNKWKVQNKIDRRKFHYDFFFLNKQMQINAWVSMFSTIGNSILFSMLQVCMRLCWNGWLKFKHSFCCRDKPKYIPYIYEVTLKKI